jgi:glycolate oxidase FAD binding subunit
MTRAADRIVPQTPQELAQAVGRCDREGLKVAIAGGGTLRGMGLPAERTDVTLVTTGLTSVVDYRHADLTIAAQAGISLQSLSALLAQHGQFVPFDAPQPHQATLGGTLAAGWLGPRRHLYGRPRDHLLGTTVALADGTIARAGGMVVKNVAGYDMSRLYAGSFGTLCVLLRANLKTLALPARMQVFVAPLPDGTRARACRHVAELAIPPAAALWVTRFHHAVDGDDGPEGRLFVAFEGSDAMLARASRDLRSALGRAGVPETRVIDAGARESLERAIDAYVACLGERSITYRLYGMPSAALQRTLGLHELAERFDLRFDSLADLMNGDVILRVSDLDARAFGAKIEIFDDALHDIEPRAQVVAGDHPHRPYLRVWGEPPPALERMRALKMRFDPNRTLNPGCFIGGI